jgi:hypothetical protein
MEHRYKVRWVNILYGSHESAVHGYEDITMSYQQTVSQSLLSSPKGICLATQALNQTPSVGAVIAFNGLTQIEGSLYNDVSLSSGSLVLPIGYWYYVDASVEFHLVGTLPANYQQAYAKTSLYEGTQRVSTQGHNAMQQSGKDSALFSADEKSLALIDATASAVTLTMKLDDVYLFNAINNTTDAQYVYAGQGRALIIQLEAP